MKKIITLVVLLTSLNTYARICTFGKIGDDNHIKITFNESNIEFNLHESSFAIEDDKFKNNNNGSWIIIPNQSVNTTTEGEYVRLNVFGIILFNKNTATVYLETDGYPISENQKFKCNY
ncbi:MAG: hypothetical protein ACK41T_02730 [Pseudobdellovibrio sp.]